MVGINTNTNKIVTYRVNCKSLDLLRVPDAFGCLRIELSLFNLLWVSMDLTRVGEGSCRSAAPFLDNVAYYYMQCDSVKFLRPVINICSYTWLNDQ